MQVQADSVEPCVFSVKRRKLDRVMDVLTQYYAPFNQLTEVRLQEVMNLIRIIEMREGEIFQLHPVEDNDYLFVIEGNLEMIREGSLQTISGPTKAPAKALILSKKSQSTTLVARAESIVCHADRQLLDYLISWDVVAHELHDSDDEVRLRMEQVRNSLVFRRLPWESVEAAFERMTAISAKAGTEVIRQGEPGDAFYIITSGTAEIYHAGSTKDAPQKMTVIGEGDAFGCEALISGRVRSETVRMIEDGTLLSLGKTDFDWLISKQMIKAVNATVAKTMLDTGYKLIDVRTEEEYEYGYIPGATLIPLFDLKQRIAEFDPHCRYILYCHSGSRSSVAALRLTQAGFDVQTLEGGFSNWPYEIAE
jgi:rhodanese-related sulfurtransferase/signal-transduction protein with cAMP-binding, CBS, and nucleotidyltransferase domain